MSRRVKYTSSIILLHGALPLSLGDMEQMRQNIFIARHVTHCQCRSDVPARGIVRHSIPESNDE